MIIKQIKDNLISLLQDNSNEIMDKIYLWIYLAKKELQYYNFDIGKKEYKETVNNLLETNLPENFEKIDKVYLNDELIYEKKSNINNDITYEISNQGKIEIDPVSTLIVSSNNENDIFTITLEGDVREQLSLNGESIEGEYLATGDGTQTGFSGTFANDNIQGETIYIHYTIGGDEYTATDDNAGNIAGTNITSGTINYLTGDYNITFTIAPDDTKVISADYKRKVFKATTQSFSYLQHIVKSESLGNIIIKDESDTTIYTTNDLNIVDWFVKSIKFNTEITGDLKLLYFGKIEYTNDDYNSDEWTYKYGDLISLFCLWRGFTFQDDAQTAGYYYQLYQTKLKEAIKEDRREKNKNLALVFKRNPI